MRLSPAQKNLINKATEVGSFGIQWGFIPFVLYLGFKRGADPLPNGQIVPLSLMSLLWG